MKRLLRFNSILLLSLLGLQSIMAQTPFLVKDIVPGMIGSLENYVHSAMVSTNGLLIFSTSDGNIWKSDATEAWTVMLKDVFTGSGYAQIESLTAVGNKAFFLVVSRNGYAYDLWVTDGTEVGTTKVAVDLTNGGFSPHRPGTFANGDGRLYFVHNNGVNGAELWTSDGTASGTRMVKDINSGTTSSEPNHLIGMNNKLYFNANSGTGYSFYETDGTQEGTRIVKEAMTISSAINVNGTLYFGGDDLYKSDGTAAGTVSVSLGKTGFPVINLTNVNGKIFYTAGMELFKSDGTVEGTAKVGSIVFGGNSDPNFFTNVNGTLFFIASAERGPYKEELYKSDGTQFGTALVKDLTPGAHYSTIKLLTAVNKTLYFSGLNTLWKSDGTAEGTVAVTSVPSISNTTFLTNINGVLFFAAHSPEFGIELWAVDGSGAPAAPTNLMIAPLRAIAAPSSVRLDWTDNSANENGFSIERSLSASSGFVPIDSVFANVTAFADSNFTGEPTTYYYRVKSYNNSGNSIASNSVSVVAAELTGIFDSQKTSLITVYPNPSSSSITVSGLSNGMLLKVMNPLGAVIKEKIISSDNLDLQISELPKGIYFLQAQSAEKRYVGKFIKD